MNALFFSKKINIISGFFIVLASALFLSTMPVLAQPAAEDPFGERVPGNGQEGNLPGAKCPLQVEELFGFVTPWYAYLNGVQVEGGRCMPSVSQPQDIWLIVAAIFQALLQISGVVAVAMMIYAGYKYLLSRGQPNEVAAAKTTITNTVFGIIFIVFATRIVGFIANNFIVGNAGGAFLLPIPVAGNPIQAILSIVFQIAGALAVVMVAWGGITYIRSAGDPNAVKEAKNTILYALVGLLIAIFATALVQFIFDRI